VIGFEGIPDVEARLVNFDLEDLDNLPNGVSGAIGNILFNGQTEIQDSFDVANANQNLEGFSTRTQSRSSMTWITTPRAGMTLMMSSMVGGNDTLTGLSGDDSPGRRWQRYPHW